MRAVSTPLATAVGLRFSAAVGAAPATRLGISPFHPGRRFTTSARRSDDQSHAKAGSLRQVLNRPEITPLFLFTSGIICLGLFFAGRHLFRDKELRLDHAQQNRLKTQTENLNFEAMKHVADDPDGKLTREAIEEDHKRSQRKTQIQQEKVDKANDKI